MKIKIVGFKVGKSRPTANRVYDSTRIEPKDPHDTVNDLFIELGKAVWRVLDKSDFVSIRRVDE
jgi:hypothetical protein